MGVPYAEVIGDPIAHSKSPLIHKFWLNKLGLAGDYRATRVTAAELPAYFAARRTDPDWRGCNVTMPLKISASRKLDCLEGAAKAIGAVNCVIPAAAGLLGSNTDVDGIQAAIKTYPWSDVCLLGNGGAARSVLWHLSNANRDAYLSRHRKCMTFIVARDEEKSSRLLEEFGLPGKVYSFDSAAEAFVDVVLIINATLLGMAGQPALPRSVLDGLKLAYADATVFDMVYSPVETALLREARRNEFWTIDGLTMLIAQAGKCFQRFYGARAPRENDIELRELLTQCP